MNHVFILSGSLAALAARQIVETEIANARNALACSHDSTHEDRVFVFTTVEVDWPDLGPHITLRTMHPSPSQMSEWVKPFRIAKWFRGCLDEVLTGEDERIVVYASHVFDLPANHFVYADTRVVRRELLPDGLVNYVPRPLLPEGLRKVVGFGGRLLLRWIAARSVGLKYKMLIKGDLTQYQSGLWVRCWCFESRGLVTKVDEVRKLELLQKTETASDRIEGRSLVIDQELSEIADPDLAERIRATLLQVVAQESPRDVFYKKHPRGRDRLERMQAAGLSPTRAPEGMAEQTVLDLRVDRLIGYYSTPLLLLSGLPIRRVAVLPVAGARGVRRPRFVRSLRDALVESGAEVIGVE